VTGIVVTRGDVPLTAAVPLDMLGEVIIWDNSSRYRKDLSVYGRYAAIDDARRDVILVQDDDFVLPAESIKALLRAYEPGRIVANMPERFRPRYPDSCLVGMGAIFDRDLPAQAFARLAWSMPEAEMFYRTCDVFFTTLTPFTLVDLPVETTEWTYAENRMYRQETHTPERARALALARAVRDR
jgi:hypothetical protein